MVLIYNKNIYMNLLKDPNENVVYYLESAVRLIQKLFKNSRY